MDKSWNLFFAEDMDQINEVLFSDFLDNLRISTILYLPVTSAKDTFKKRCSPKVLNGWIDKAGARAKHSAVRGSWPLRDSG